jgi:hypothetical protein
MEKQLYSSGYHVEWFHSKKDQQEFTATKEIETLPIISASENSTIILNEEVPYILPIQQKKIEADTIVPSNPAETDEEYVTPNIITRETYDPENTVLNAKDRVKLDRLAKYLIVSAILTIIPFYILYFPVLLINLRVINKIKRLAKFSPYESYYLNKIKKYWRIMCWPLYVIGFALFISLLVLALYGL